MDHKTTLMLVLSMFSLACMIGTTAVLFFGVRSRTHQISVITEPVLNLARPRGKGWVVAMSIGALATLVALVASYFDDLHGISPLLGPLIQAVVFLSLWIQYNLQRTQALETIIKISRPDIFAQIKGPKG
jgi:hypothetical protein